MKTKLTIITVIVIVSVYGEDFAPIYSPSYANVYYQRAEGGTSRYGEKFNLTEKEQEDLDLESELNPSQDGDNDTETTIIYDDVSPTSDPDTATEPDSEQVHIVRKKNKMPKKLKENLELSEEVEPSDMPESTNEPDLNERGIYYIYHPNNLLQKDIPNKDVELFEELEPVDKSKLADAPDLSKQGIYYIYHPSGLLQRVVFAARNDVQNMEYFAQFNYQNIKPILEPIYSYDPDTYAFQRLRVY